MHQYLQEIAANVAPAENHSNRLTAWLCGSEVQESFSWFETFAHLKILQDQLKSPPVEFSYKQSFCLHSVFRCSVAPKHTGHCWGLTGERISFLREKNNICKADFLNWGNALFLFEPPVDGLVWSHRQDCFFVSPQCYWWPNSPQGTFKKLLMESPNHQSIPIGSCERNRARRYLCFESVFEV